MLVTGLDAVWTVQAFSVAPRHRGSNVAMVSLTVWVVLHLPATLLAGFLWGIRGAGSIGATGLGPQVWLTLGALGLAETFALVGGLALVLGRRR